MRTKTTTKEVIEEFKLELPVQLQIEPEWTVQLPAKHIALIYATKIQARRVNEYVDIPGWKIVVHNRHGKIPTQLYHHLDAFESPLDLKLRLEELAVYLTPKKRTTKHSEDFEEE